MYKHRVNNMFLYMEFILERERSHEILRGLHMQCKKIYCPKVMNWNQLKIVVTVPEMALC